MARGMACALGHAAGFIRGPSASAIPTLVCRRRPIFTSMAVFIPALIACKGMLPATVPPPTLRGSMDCSRRQPWPSQGDPARGTGPGVDFKQFNQHHRRWSVSAILLAGAPLALAAAAFAEQQPRSRVVDKISYSQQENAGLPAQSNRDVAKYADLGEGLKAIKLDKPKFADGDPNATRVVAEGDRVAIDLIGYLSGWNGLVFVRTQDKSGFSENPVTFRVGAGEAIRGLDRGVLGMVKGEKRRLVVPSNLGYQRPLREEDLGKPGAIPNPMASAAGSGAPWELRNRLLNGVVNNSSRDDTLVFDVKVLRISS